MSDASRIKLWQSLVFKDGDAMIPWLQAVGFVEHVVHRDDADPSVVQHAEFIWPGGGGIMFGTHDLPIKPGTGAAYLVTGDPDGVYGRAIEAGGKSVNPPHDEGVGGRGASVFDPEGNLWSFGDYQPS